MGVLQWLRSAATPATLATSYSASSVTMRFILSSRLSGWPMPPPAPRTATLLQGQAWGREGKEGGRLARRRRAAAAAGLARGGGNAIQRMRAGPEACPSQSTGRSPQTDRASTSRAEGRPARAATQRGAAAATRWAGEAFMPVALRPEKLCRVAWAAIGL